jgi:GNAT superfamily N-acetyltransferase
MSATSTAVTEGVARVRPVTADDAPQLARMLAGSFETCPAWGAFLPRHANHRLERMEHFFRFLLTRMYLRPGRECLTTQERAGAALWDPPGEWKLGAADNVRMLAAMVPVFRRHLPHAVACFNAMDAGHPAEPHWYLSVLGVDRTARTAGVASALIAPVLNRCDREGVAAYTETGRPRSRDFYSEHGFDVIEEFELPGGGPAVWRMWREPRREE